MCSLSEDCPYLRLIFCEDCPYLEINVFCLRLCKVLIFNDIRDTREDCPYWNIMI